MQQQPKEPTVGGRCPPLPIRTSVLTITFFRPLTTLSYLAAKSHSFSDRFGSKNFLPAKLEPFCLGGSGLFSILLYLLLSPYALPDSLSVLALVTQVVYLQLSMPVLPVFGTCVFLGFLLVPFFVCTCAYTLTSGASSCACLPIQSGQLVVS